MTPETRGMVIDPLKKWKRRYLITRKILKIVGITFIAAQGLIFVSFIYEEALQANGFAIRTAIQSRDRNVALEAMKNYETIMRDAQSFQKNYGWIAFWSHKAFSAYFGVAAPAQLSSSVSYGAYEGLWGPDVRRWKLEEVTSRNGKHWAFIDTWKCHPIRKLELEGFDVKHILSDDFLATEHEHRIHDHEAPGRVPDYYWPQDLSKEDCKKIYKETIGQEEEGENQ